MKFIRVTLLVLGALLFLGGLAGDIFIVIASSRMSNDYGCSASEREYKKMEQLGEQYKAAKGTPRELELELELKNQIKIAERWGEACANIKASKRFRLVSFISLTISGLVFLLAGFFVGRKKKMT